MLTIEKCNNLCCHPKVSLMDFDSRLVPIALPDIGTTAGEVWVELLLVYSGLKV